MDSEKKLQLVRQFYAGVLADAVLQMGQEGVLPQVTARKKQEQLLTGQALAAQLGITRPEEVFTRLSDIFNCARWVINQEANGFTAETPVCLLCSIAKKLGGPSPCNLYCLDPMEGLVRGVAPEACYEVQETLWDGEKCRVKVML